MEAKATHFQFIYNLALINAEKTKIGDIESYKLAFPNEVPSINLVSLLLDDGTYEWDTIPSGNKELSAALGKLIEEHFAAHPAKENEE